MKALKTSLRLFKDKVILGLSLVPILIGALLYGLLSTYVFSDVFAHSQKWIQSLGISGFGGTIVSEIILVLLTVLLYGVICWTFVLTVSLIAAPFNDMISERVERLVRGNKSPYVHQTVLARIKGALRTLVNEFKKVCLLGSLSIGVFFLNFFPPLFPVSLFLSAVLMAFAFLDYSYCRHDYPLKKCLLNIRNNLFTYALTGLIFFMLFSLPLINLFALPLAVVFFTVLFVERSKSPD